jgi:hypothetical protein
MRFADWRSTLLAGDWVVMLTAAAGSIALFPLLWTGGAADKAVIRSEGRVFAEIDLAAKKTLSVPGPLGATVIAVEAGRARVVSDPGPRQYCVLQGWLQRNGDLAICAPNRVSLQVTGRGGRNAAYDSLAY